MLNNETGSLMVITVVLLMLLTIMGLAITTTTSIELQIAANDRIHKTTFYAADGATDVASELLEQNLGCMTEGGFSSADINTIRVLNLDFWANRSNDPDFVSIPSETIHPFPTRTSLPAITRDFQPAAPCRWSAATKAKERRLRLAALTCSMKSTPSIWALPTANRSFRSSGGT